MSEIAATFGMTRRGAQKLVGRAKRRLMERGVDIDDWMLADEMASGE